MSQNDKVVLAIRHPKVEGEGTGEATAARDARSGLSAEGQAQIEQIVTFLRVFSPAQIVCGEAPRYRQVGEEIAKALGIPLVPSESLGQEGGRSSGEERVEKLRAYRATLRTVIEKAENRTILITSNPLLEASLHEGEITLETMEEHRKDFRTDPGNGLLLDGEGKPLARINLFWSGQTVSANA
jgi:phosphohistidine phosphatase SixA